MRFLGLLIAAMIFAGPALADDVPEDLQAIASETLSSARMTKLAATCPDQLWKDRNVFTATFLPKCKTAKGCRRQCGLGDGKACWDLARMFQNSEPAVPPIVSGSWFARACANNYASGCTNRGAGILMAEPEDPFTDGSEQDRQQCAARAFVLSCEAEDAWGCTMHAGDLMQGILGPADPAAAKLAARKACILDPDDSVEACSYAKAWVGE